MANTFDAGKGRLANIRFFLPDLASTDDDLSDGWIDVKLWGIVVDVVKGDRNTRWDSGLRALPDKTPGLGLWWQPETRN